MSLREIERGLAYMSAHEISGATNGLPDVHTHPSDQVQANTERLGRVLVTFKRHRYKRHKYVHEFWTACKVERPDDETPDPPGAATGRQ